ncbi:MAG: entericidin A/B family lipoprotein [Limnohabitans sp.]
MKTLASFLIAFSLLALSACNTMRGIGQDIEKLGSSIEGAAKK